MFANGNFNKYEIENFIQPLFCLQDQLQLTMALSEQPTSYPKIEMGSLILMLINIHYTPYGTMSYLSIVKSYYHDKCKATPKMSHFNRGNVLTYVLPLNSV